MVGFVGWFGGLFYLVRIFVYHVEALGKESHEKNILLPQYEIMESRAYKLICNTGIVVTWIFGVLMLVSYGSDWLRVNSWMHIKLSLIALLTIYHWYCGRIILKLKDQIAPFNSEQFRIFNEVPSVLLLAIVLLAVFRNTLDLVKASIAIFVFAVVIILLVRLYKKYRQAS